MNREEFLGLLREALEGKVPEQVISDNVNYYRSYINGQMADGRSESQVLGMLGDPRLLAKTIEESCKFASGTDREWGSRTGEYGNYSGAHSENIERPKNGDSKYIRLPGWLVAVIVVLVFILGIMLVFKAFVVLAPFIIIFMLAGFIYSIVRGWLNK